MRVLKPRSCRERPRWKSRSSPTTGALVSNRAAVNLLVSRVSTGWNHLHLGSSGPETSVPLDLRGICAGHSTFDPLSRFAVRGASVRSAVRDAVNRVYTGCQRPRTPLVPSRVRSWAREARSRQLAAIASGLGETHLHPQ